MRVCSFLLMLLAASSPAAAQTTDLKRSYNAAAVARLTPELIRSKVTVKDDALEPVATLSTDKGFISKGSFFDKVKSDNFLRAFIDKGSRAVRYQLYATVTYGPEWRHFTTASALFDGRPRSIPLTVISKAVVTCAAGYCVMRETVGIALDQSDVEQIAAGYRPGASQPWAYRLKAQSGLDFDDSIMPAEAAGLMLAVREYRQRHRLPEPAPAH